MASAHNSGTYAARGLVSAENSFALGGSVRRGYKPSAGAMFGASRLPPPFLPITWSILTIQSSKSHSRNKLSCQCWWPPRRNLSGITWPAASFISRRQKKARCGAVRVKSNGRGVMDCRAGEKGAAPPRLPRRLKGKPPTTSLGFFRLIIAPATSPPVP